ncbi:MAG: cobaltochelatase subunit CobN, partial [Bacillota bacterium]
MKRITAVLWHSHVTTMRRARELVKGALEVTVYSARFLDEGKEDLARALEDMARADLVFLYRSAAETVWDELEKNLKDPGKPVVCVAHDPSLWTLSTVGPDVISQCYAYIVQGGPENFAHMLRYLAAEVLGEDIAYREPVIFPWEGIYHPDAPRCFAGVEEYLSWYRAHRAGFNVAAPTVGLLFGRSYWVNGNQAVEDLLIRLLEEKGLNVIPAFCYSL